MWTLLAALALADDPAISGDYALALDAAGLAAVHERAVNDALKALPWAFRPIARGRLESAVRTCGGLRLDLGEALFSVQCDGQPRFEHPRDRRSGRFTADDGKTYDVSFAVDPGEVRLGFSGQEGGQRSTYLPQADGSLVLRKELFSEHLSQPVSWSVRYVRRD